MSSPEPWEIEAAEFKPYVTFNQGGIRVDVERMLREHGGIDAYLSVNFPKTYAALKRIEKGNKP